MPRPRPTANADAKTCAALARVHRDLEACRRCPNMIGPVVHGPAVPSRVLLLGQAPGPHEGKFMRPFAWTAGRTLFKWFHSVVGLSEEEFRAKIYIAAVARCFPGKAKGGGDRRPDAAEIAACGTFLAREARILQPDLIIPVGTLAIEQVLGRKAPLADVVGRTLHADFHGVSADVVALPHPSGASPWHKLEPGKSLLNEALGLIRAHPAMA